MPVYNEKETITQLLEAIREGDPTAFNKLFPLVYQELHDLAHRQRRDWKDYTL